MRRDGLRWLGVLVMAVALWMCDGRPQVDCAMEQKRCEELLQTEFLSRGQLVLAGDFSERGLLSEEGICYKGIALLSDTLALCEIKRERQGRGWSYQALAPRPFFEQEAVLRLPRFDQEEAVVALRTYLEEPAARVKVMDELTVRSFRVCMLHKFGYGDAADAYLVSLPDGTAALCVTHDAKGPLFMDRFYDFARQELSGEEAIGKSKVSLSEIRAGNDALRPTCQPTF